MHNLSKSVISDAFFATVYFPINIITLIDYSGTVMKLMTHLPFLLKMDNVPVSILYESIAGRYRPVSYPDGPITARYRFM